MADPDDRTHSLTEDAPASRKPWARGDAGLETLANPVALTGDPTADLEVMRVRLEAQAGLVRAIAFQREVDAVGGRTLGSVMLKSSPALTALVKRLGKMSIGAP